jgi:predicted ester cyclase
MTTEQAKAVARNHYEHFDNLEAAFAQVAQHVRFHALPGLPPTYEGWKQAHAMFMAAFPDQQLAIEDQFAEGNTVVTRWLFSGTHQGALMGITATGKPVALKGISIDRVQDGAVVEHWAQMDQVGLMQQLGVMPAPDRA